MIQASSKGRDIGQSVIIYSHNSAVYMIRVKYVFSMSRAREIWMS